MSEGFRALRLHAPATPDAAPQARIERLRTEDLSPGAVVVDVAYSSLNYKDALALAGRNAIVRDYPRIGGIDLTGRVRESTDPRWAPGDAVLAHGLGLGIVHDGGHAERARVPGDWLHRLPAALSLQEAATIGAAGYTAALAIQLMEHNGLAPGQGPVLVTGATGGVASVAIDLLAGRGYEVVALTGKPDAADGLRGLGAAEVLDRRSLALGTRPLESARWAGAVDSVGGELLAWITRTMKPQGVITAFGNAGGADLATTVMPFILRGVRLIGIGGTGGADMPARLWQRLGTDLRPRHLDRIARLVELEDVPATGERMLRGDTRGRTVVRLAP